MRQYLLPALLLICCLHCTLMPEYVRPTQITAPTWPQLPGYASLEGEQAAAALTWNTYFEIPELREILSLAMNHNKDLRLAALNVDAAQAVYRIERSNLYPDVVATGSASIERTSEASSSSGESMRRELYRVGVGVASYEVDFFGKVRSRNQMALNEFFATEESAKVVVNALLAEVANAYFQLIADQSLLVLTEKTLVAQKQTIDLLDARLRQGLGTEQDLARATTALETAQINLYRFRRFVAQDENALTLLLGLPQNEIPLPKTAMEEMTFKTQLDPGLPSEVLLARPDIRQREYELLARNADIGAARAAFYPSITLTGSVGFASESVSKLFSSSAAGAWSFLPQINLPIFNSGRLKANLNLAEIRQEQAVIAYEQTVQIAFREVADSLVERQTLADQLNAHDRQIVAAKKAYDIAQARYKAGIDSFLDVLDAQRELYQFQQNRIQTHLALWQNHATLFKSLGGGVLDVPGEKRE